jgi:transmembrane 9 superfamily protein 3
MTCASAAGYIYLYSIYYYVVKTKYVSTISFICYYYYFLVKSTNNNIFIYFRMTGMFQTSFYFGYTALLSLGMFCMLGKYNRSHVY